MKLNKKLVIKGIATTLTLLFLSTTAQAMMGMGGSGGGQMGGGNMGADHDRVMYGNGNGNGYNNMGNNGNYSQGSMGQYNGGNMNMNMDTANQRFRQYMDRNMSGGTYQMTEIIDNNNHYSTNIMNDQGVVTNRLIIIKQSGNIRLLAPL